MVWQHTERKIFSREKLARRLKVSSKYQRIIFTNGCFDIIHKGHISYLERARSLGDALVVALNSDSSVRRLKGRGRPVNPLRDRIIVLAALECVDFVTWFSEETPLKTILTIRPDHLVKGGDWPVGSIVGSKEVQSWGGKVHSLPFIKGRSTTRILQVIKSL